MSFYNFKNVNLLLNGNEILANSVELSTEATLNPNYITSERHAIDYTPSDNLKGNLRISYYLNGPDYVKTLTTTDNIVSGYFGGIYFTGGYLNSYHLNAVPNAPVKIDANILFFDQLQGTLQPVAPRTDNYNVLNFSDASLDYLNGYSAETINNVQSIDYTYVADVKPVYYFDNTTGNNYQPHHVIFGNKQIETLILCDDLQTDFPVYGKNMGIKINFNNPNIPNLVENVTSTGILYKKDISVQNNDVVKNLLSIKQNRTDTEPIISYFTPVSGGYNNRVTIFGSNFSNAVDVMFGDTSDYSFQVFNDTEILAHVPKNALSGNISVRNFGGNTTFTASGFNVIYEIPTVNSLIPYYGRPGIDSILISGSNFYRTDEVTYSGGATGVFKVISPSLIQSYIPTGAQYGKLSISSSSRNYSIISNYEFVPTPNIVGFNPQTGLSGDAINISGVNFSGISNVYFNNVSVSGFSVTNNYTITTYVPSGLTNGYISLIGFSGINSISPSQFIPSIIISGVGNSNVGTAGTTPVRLSGVGFLSGLLDSLGNDFFKVSFDNAIGTDFKIVNSNLITGTLPLDAAPGTGRALYVYRTSGTSSVLANIKYTVNNNSPIIYQINPNLNYFRNELTSGVSSGFAIQGKNLFSIQNIRLTGLDTNNIGYGYFLTPPNNIISDKLGQMIIVTGVNFSTPTGAYSVGVNCATPPIAWSTGYSLPLNGTSSIGIVFGGIISSGVFITPNFTIFSS